MIFKNHYSKKLGANALDSNEDINIILDLWEKLDLMMSNREKQLDLALINFEQMQSNYDKLDKNIRKMCDELNSVRSQLVNVSYFSILIFRNQPIN